VFDLLDEFVRGGGLHDVTINPDTFRVDKIVFTLTRGKNKIDISTSRIMISGVVSSNAINKASPLS
jgi:hypothetical protein